CLRFLTARRPPPRSTLFPYTTLFRSLPHVGAAVHHLGGGGQGDPGPLRHVLQGDALAARLALRHVLTSPAAAAPALMRHLERYPHEPVLTGISGTRSLNHYATFGCFFVSFAHRDGSTASARSSPWRPPTWRCSTCPSRRCGSTARSSASPRISCPSGRRRSRRRARPPRRSCPSNGSTTGSR